jgi:hypothetical protein
VPAGACHHVSAVVVRYMTWVRCAVPSYAVWAYAVNGVAPHASSFKPE